jgi:predicted RNase H-like nuclease
MDTLLCEYMYSTVPPSHLQDFSRVRVAGIDGCRGGWFALVLEGILSPSGCPEEPSFRVAESLVFGTEDHSALEKLLEGVRLALIDIPIGLPARGDRQSDYEVRRLLGARRSSVFPMPVRDAVHADTYEEACRINAAATGKKLSKQTWNILSKVRSIDRFLRMRKEYRLILRESSPEYCFVLAAAGWGAPAGGEGPPVIREGAFAGPVHGKRTLKGIRERSAILAASLPEWDRLLREVRGGFLRKDLADDDIIDAGILGVSAYYAVACAGLGVPDEVEYDEYGIPVQALFGTRGKH